MTTVVPPPAGVRPGAAADPERHGGFSVDQVAVEEVWTVGSRRPRPRLWGWVLLAALSPVAIAAATVTALVRDGEPPADVLVLGDDGAVTSVDPSSGLPQYSLADASVSADGSAVYQTVETEAGTEVRQVDPTTGLAVGATLVKPGLAIRTVSPDGGAVALMEPPTVAGGLYVPEPRTETSITVVWQDRPEPAVFDLEGNFEPETFTLTEDTLYLLEYWPPLEPDRYYVRQLDLASGVVRDVFSPQVELQPEMRGRARAQAIAPDSSVLYTLYTIPAGDDPVHDLTAPNGTDDARWAFVHVLSLEEDWSYCVFLPVPIGTTSEAAVSMAISPEGHQLYVVDAATQTVAVIDTSALVVTRSTPVPALRPQEEPTELAVGPDGTLYVASPWSVVAVSPDLATLSTALGTQTGEQIGDIALSADGRELRVAAGGQVLVWDLVDRREVARLDVPGDGGVSFVGPPGESLLEIPVDKA